MGSGKPVYSSYKTGLNTSTHSKNTPKNPSDFSNEYVGKNVKVVLYNSVVEGVLEKSTKYWFKISNGGRTVYVNKAWVVFVEPSL